MSRRCLFNSVTLGLILWCELAAWYFDNGPLLILGFFAGLIWTWGAVGPGDYDADNENAPARVRVARRTTHEE